MIIGQSMPSPKAAQKRTHYKTLARQMALHTARQRLVVLWCSTALGWRADFSRCFRNQAEPAL